MRAMAATDAEARHAVSLCKGKPCYGGEPYYKPSRDKAWFVVQHALVLVKLPALAILRDAKVASVHE